MFCKYKYLKAERNRLIVCLNVAEHSPEIKFLAGNVNLRGYPGDGQAAVFPPKLRGRR